MVTLSSLLLTRNDYVRPPHTVLAVANIAAMNAIVNPNVGLTVQVLDTGYGDYALYIWNGTAWQLQDTTDSSTVNARTLTLAFDYSAAPQTMIGNISAGVTIKTIDVEIITGFDGNPNITIGTLVDPTLLIADASLIDFADTGINTITPDYDNVGPAPLDLYLFFSGGGTVGTANLIITYL